MRNPVISICKGIAIILMVMGHAEPPTLLSNFIYIFHMPLFFITAGYFFSRKHADNPWTFCSRRFKKLYIPFLKWSIFFLLMHNLWFEWGLLNEQYGNWTGGVTHPYDVKMFFRRLFLIVTSMSGYDEFMAGAFWFFRGLLVASILFLIIYKMVDSRFNLSHVRLAGAVCLAAFLFQAYRLGFGFKINVIPNGGLREIWGVFFFGIGVIFREFESRICHRWWILTACAGVMCLGAFNHWCGMNNSGQIRDIFTLPLTGCAGFMITHWVATVIVRLEGRVMQLLSYIGENTLQIFVLHIISYKVVSAMKIAWYGLDPGQIGCHMVIHFNNHADLFWIAYTIAGTAIPLLLTEAWRRWLSPAATRLVPKIISSF